MLPNEPIVPADQAVRSSERTFGIVFAIFFTLVAVWPAVSGARPRFWALAVASAILLVAVMRPRLLLPFNALWFRLGQLLHHVVNPVIMFVIYWAAVVPTGLLMKALGKDPLHLRIDRSLATYWIARQPPGPAAGTMRKQY